MDEETFQNLKVHLQDADIDIYRCKYHDKQESRCKEWIVIDNYGARGIQCDNCKKYYCREHGKQSVINNTYTVVIKSICINCDYNE